MVAPGVTLHAERREGAPGRTPFILIHGLASNLRLWDAVAERLAADGHPILTVDQRGHGRSDAPEIGYDLDTAVDDLRAVLAASRLPRPVVVGQSWGGNVVLELALRWPEAVSGIVGVDGGLTELADVFPAWDTCLAALTPPRLEGLTPEALETRVREAYPGFPEHALAAVLANFRVRPDGGVEPRLARPRHLAILRALWEHRPSTRLHALAVPALLLLADTGNGTMTAAKQRAETRARAVTPLLRAHWRRAHHDVHVQHPDWVAAMLTRSLADGFLGGTRA